MSSTVDRTYLRNLDWIVTVDATDTVVRDATVVIDGDTIAAVGTTDEVLSQDPPRRTDVVIDARGLGLSPGFIDTHVHLSETLSRAVFPDNISTRTWVFHWGKPFYAHVGVEDEGVSVRLGAAEMLRNGTTCFLDMGAQNDPGITATGAAEVGIRGVVGRHAADRPPAELPPGWSPEMVEHHFFANHVEALDALGDAVRRWNGHADGRIRCWVNIEGKEPCSLELHVGARALAAELGVGTTYHLASSIEEAHVSEKKYGKWPISRIGDTDGLGPNLVLAHAVAVADAEVELLSSTGTSVAFCPFSSLKLGKGATSSIGRYPEMLEAGVTVGLGTDGVAAAGNMNLMRQIPVVAGMFKDARLDESLIGARRALRMATIDGARALGWDDEIGSIEVGKQADFVLWDLHHPEWIPYGDPVLALGWSASTASISQTWVAGRLVYRDGAVVSLDEKALRAEATARARAIVARAGLGAQTPTSTVLYD
ncbi:amidohydrolase family protein [Mycolicibacterium parafortuitum]|uniref:Amidohydrolase family protein n=1 Tax=Mycolicibacterium parafortuitum TaxID=39692 RepID=A0ACC6MA87_MYCPF|nr:amidohydrolase family protein [Mycolicibacterium parafortuitum]MDZ5083854.1 amidohydrolase family protein [Mycolicibacterium parafortuitum]GFM16669.1 amidohydrolase [Mycobacterium sp. PO1]GFM21648.1 amidohydrolase [Mycobacterium sp. PO2]